MQTLKIVLSTVIISSLTAMSAYAADNYTVGQDMHNLNKASFTSTATLASFTGTTQDVTGSAEVDMANLKNSKGDIKINLKTLDTGISRRNEHMNGVLQTEKNQYAIFRLKSIDKYVKTLPAYKTVIVPITGDLTINGVTKPIKTTLDLTYMPEKDKNYRAGQWIRMQTAFNVKLSDHGIKAPGIVPLKLNDTVGISLDIMGMKK